MATSNNPTQNPEAGGRSPDLIFPQHLAQLIAQDVSHPHLVITNNEDQEAIFLPVPASLQLGDGANYEGLDRATFQTAEAFASEGAGSLEAADKLAMGLSQIKNFPGADILAKDQMFRNRVALNPMQEMAFTGMSMRELSLSFDMVPRNEDEAHTIRNIERKLRKLMYPEKAGTTGFSVRYPAMFQLQFMSGEKESQFFPLFHHAYLKGLETNFRGQAGGYHRTKDNDYMGLKHTLSLSFAEARMLTRNDIVELPERGEMARNQEITDADASAAEKAGKGGKD